MFKFTLTTAASVFLLMSGAADLFAMEPLDDDHPAERTSNKIFPDLSNEMGSLIIEDAAFKQCLNNELPVNLALVCKTWHAETQYHMEPGKLCYKAWYGIFGHEDIYETFLKGVLLYRPIHDSDEGMITLKISELKDTLPEGETSYKLLKKNLLEGTFDLSACGKEGKYHVISTGHPKGINPENKNKTEIWIAPHFMIEKKNANAPHFNCIMGNRDKIAAPVGVLYTCWDERNEYFDDCTTKDLDFVYEDNLCKWYGAAAPGGCRLGSMVLCFIFKPE
ncbi:MAG: hypothetical protein H0X26_08050 [Alphaproteobacteria bacterium]|nr:hypothetical protein [Alphaproteobacteria bacterium]